MRDQENLTSVIKGLQKGQTVRIHLFDGRIIDGIIERERNPNGWVISFSFGEGNIYFGRQGVEILRRGSNSSAYC